MHLPSTHSKAAAKRHRAVLQGWVESYPVPYVVQPPEETVITTYATYLRGAVKGIALAKHQVDGLDTNFFIADPMRTWCIRSYVPHNLVAFTRKGEHVDPDSASVSTPRHIETDTVGGVIHHWKRGDLDEEELASVALLLNRGYFPDHQFTSVEPYPDWLAPTYPNVDIYEEGGLHIML